jgi:predicted site-specific integrase-resolvase
MTDKLLTVAAAAEALGMSEKGIRNWILLRQIAYVKLPQGPVRIKESTIQDLIEEGTVRALH